MKLKIVLLFVVATIFACNKKESSESLLAEIDAIYELPEGLTAENSEKLIVLKEKYISLFDDSMSVIFSNEVGFYFYQKDETEKAEKYLLNFIEKSDNSEFQGHAYVTLAKNYAKMEKYDEALTAIQKALNTEYSPMGGGLSDIINVVESKINSKGADANDYLILFNTAKSAQQPQMALAMADSILLNFRDYDKRPELLFSAANVAWDLLDDQSVSIKYFKSIVDDYPSHELSKEAQYILDNNYTSMTPEQILDDILKKNKES